MSSLEKYFSDIRKSFPILNEKIHGKRLAYLDSAATGLKPTIVVERLKNYYLFETGNVHRGAHFLSDQGTQHYEEARQTVAKFINAKSSDEIIFVRGTTEGINLVAQSYAGTFLKDGDEILLTELEHHSNIVPWQMLGLQKNIKVSAVKILDSGDLDLEDLKNKINPKVKMMAVTGSSNSLGVRPSLEAIIQLCKKNNIKVLVDAAQLVSQKKIDVQSLDCDFLVFSGHKIFGPTGIGVVYGKKELLEKMPPYQGGGSMISEVKFSGTTYNDVPYRFEAGTPHIAGAIGLKSALDFFMALDREKVEAWETELFLTAKSELAKIPGVKFYGESSEQGPIVSFNVSDFHHSDVANIVDREGVAIRAGHHCTQPLMARLGLSGTLRASFSIYNDHQDIAQLVDSVKKAKEMLI